jgi:subtilisin family serine protease
MIASLALAIVAALPSAAAAGTVPGEVIVKFEPGASKHAREAGVDAVDGEVLGTIRARTKVLEVDGPIRAAVAKLERRGAVAWAEPVRATRSLAASNDPLMSTQWGLRNTAQYSGGIAGADIDAEAAWDITRGAGTLVGVVDTGVRFEHPDLGGFWWNGGEVAGNGRDDDHNGHVDDMRGWDFQNGDATPADDNGHGTAVTSVAAARSNNLVGMAGVAGGASLIEAKALDAGGAGDTGRLAAAFDYLGRQGARVVNASIGGGYSQAVADAVAAHPDTLYVVAAGNYGRDNETSPVYPCSLPNENLLCVGASGHADDLASFSNWGRTRVDLMAPGISVTAATLAGGYGAWNGTSFSAPMTTGVAALLFSHRPQATPTMVKQAILAGADRVAAFAAITVSGGRLNARGALDALASQMAGAPAVTVAPSISGTARLERTLTAADGTWTGASLTYRRQWLSCTAAGGSCAEIAGAQGATYAVAANDVGRTLRVRVSATDGAASAQAVSSQTAVVGADLPAVLTPPAISGSYVSGARLTGTAGSWSGAPTFAYQWLACGSTGTGCTAIAGATSLQLTLGLAQIARTLRLRVTATGAGGTAIADSAATPVITGTAPVSTVAPTVTGTARIASVLTGAAGTWTGAPVPTVTRQWLRCDAAGSACTPIAGAAAATYAAAVADLGARLRLRVTAVNAYGTVTADSPATAAVTALAPSVITAPAVTGTARQAQVLSGSDGTWQGLPAPARSRAWLRCDAAGAACAVIAGATGTSYTLTAADLSRTIRLRVTATNAAGTVTGQSAPTAVVLGPAVAPAVTAAPAITGTAQATRPLTGTPGTWTGAPAPALAGAWLRCSSAGDACAQIAGATAATYVPTTADLGATIRYRITASNLAGSQAATTAATAVVLPAPPALLVSPVITGSRVEGSTVTASTGSWSNLPTSYRYLWYRCDAVGANCTGIWGEAARTYLLTPADVGHALRARVTAENAGGASPTIATAASAVVIAR